MCVNCTVKGEGIADGTLRVMEQLRKYDDPSLWTRVSSLVLSSKGTLNLTNAVKTTDAVDTLTWFLLSSVANDVRQLL